MAQTQAEIIAVIAEIDLAISAAIEGKSYTLDSGQSRQTVTRQDLTELRDLRDVYQAELDELQNPGGGIVKIYNFNYK